MLPKFLYFDLGKVLVDFSVERMLEQMAAVAGIAPDEVHRAAFDARLIWQHEPAGPRSPSSTKPFAQPRPAVPTPPDSWPPRPKSSTLNLPMVPLVAQLVQAGYPLGILSNTCETTGNIVSADTDPRPPSTFTGELSNGRGEAGGDHLSGGRQVCGPGRTTFSSLTTLRPRRRCQGRRFRRRQFVGRSRCRRNSPWRNPIQLLRTRQDRVRSCALRADISRGLTTPGDRPVCARRRQSGRFTTSTRCFGRAGHSPELLAPGYCRGRQNKACQQDGHETK